MVDRVTRPRNERTVHGVAWTYSGGLVMLVVQLTYTAVTARLLNPEAFAAYAIAVSLAQLGSYFVGSGVSQAVLQSVRGDSDTRKAAMRIVWTAGILLAACLMTFSFFIESVWDVPDLGAMARILAWSPLAAGVAGVALALHRREGHFRLPTAVETLSLILAQLISVLLIMGGFGPVALALSSLLYPVLSAVFGWASLKTWPVFAMRSSVKIHHLSLSISGQNLAHYVQYTAPLWVLGSYAIPAVVGAYNRAQSVATVPLGQLSTAFTRVAYPRIAQSREGAAELSNRVTATVTGSMILGALIFAPIAGSSGPIVRVLLGEGWDFAVPLVATWAAWAFVNLAYVASGSVLEARRMLRPIWIGLAVAALILVLGLSLCAAYGAAPEVLLAVSVLAVLSAYATQVAYLVRNRLVSRAALMLSAVAAALSFVGVVATGSVVSSWVESAGPLWELLIVGTTSVVCACLAVLIMWVLRVAGARAFVAIAVSAFPRRSGE